MNADQLKNLQIPPGEKQRRGRSFWVILLIVIGAAIVAIYLAGPWARETRRAPASASAASTNPSPAAPATRVEPVAATNSSVSLTVSGYIINRERIEISPRFLGVVKWIGVKKGDAVTNNQVIVLLDDTEYRARLTQADGQLANARARLDRAGLNFERIQRLAQTDAESRQSLDDARLELASSRAAVTESEGAHALAQTYLDWCTIRSPIDGVVLEKLVSPNELVVPQSFGGTRGPSTALIAVADPKDLQVEIDMNEADLSKISLGQKARVSPEAYPDKTYEGVVAEIAPEADRAKGTLQIKVQIVNPDQFLTPELSAKVEFQK